MSAAILAPEQEEAATPRLYLIDGEYCTITPPYLRGNNILAPGQEEGGMIDGAYLILEPGQQGPKVRPHYAPYRGPVNPVTDPVAAEWIAERAKRYPYIGSTPRRTLGDPDNPQYSAAAGLDRCGMMLRSEDGPNGRRYYFAEPLENLPREQWPDVSRYVFGEWEEEQGGTGEQASCVAHVSDGSSSRTLAAVSGVNAPEEQANENRPAA